MKDYTYYSKHSGFQITIPDDWFESSIVDVIDQLPHNNGSFSSSTRGKSDSRTITGPNGKYLNILITPLLENETEPSIVQTEDFFDGFCNRQNLNVIETGTMYVANKEHFWATYSRGFMLTLTAGGQMQFYKKYCLYLNRAEYLLTASLYSFSSGEKLPTDQLLSEIKKVYDDIVLSLKLLINKS